MSTGSYGGVIRALRLDAEQRSAIAKQGAKARWAKPAAPVTPDMVEAARTNLTLLASIRRQFKDAGCLKTVERLDLAISSAKGAVRNLEHREQRGR